MLTPAWCPTPGLRRPPPLKLVRHIKGTSFYHMGKLPPVQEAVHRLTIEKREGGEGTRLLIDDLAGLLGLVEIGAVELHRLRVDDNPAIEYAIGSPSRLP